MLKKNQWLSFLVLILLLVGNVEYVQAEDTDMYVRFSEGNGSTIKPLDPLKPDPERPVTPVDPTNPDGPSVGTGGSLSLDYVSSFQFGTQMISSDDASYYALLQEYSDFGGEMKSGPNYIQVSDISGRGAGWQLSVKQNGQFQTVEGKQLQGAMLHFEEGEMISNLSNTNAPEGTSTFELPLDTELVVVKADKEKGMGTWLYRFGSDEISGQTAVQLKVPGSSVKYAKKYQTTLTWSLKNVP